MDLSTLIPEKTVADRYISRMFDGVRDIDMLAYAGEDHKNVLLYGPTGSAKTMLVEAYAATYDLPMATIPCNGAVEPSHFFGRYIPTTKAGVYEWQDGPVTRVAREGGILYLDEVNFLHPRIGSVLHSLLDGRRVIHLMDHGGEVIKAHKRFQTIGTYNPRYAGTRPLNAAFRNRHAIQREFGYLRAIEERLCQNIPRIIDIAEQLRSSEDSISTPTPTNALMEFEDMAIDLGLEFAVSNFIARYEPEERLAVREVINLHWTNLRSQHEVAVAEVNA